MNEIAGTPEGRAGIWLIDRKTAQAIVASCPGDCVHNFIESGIAFIGADWDKADVNKLLRRPAARIALVFQPHSTMKHQLVVIDDKRYSFDVGEIDEARMKTTAVTNA